MPSPGTTLAAAQALSTPAVHRLWTDAQVAYLLRLAFESGYQHRRHADLAELELTWSTVRRDHPAPAMRYHARMAEMEAARARHPTTAGRPPYHGGPVDYDTGRPVSP